jgi:peptide/nickel transport system permease protein
MSAVEGNIAAAQTRSASNAWRTMGKLWRHKLGRVGIIVVAFMTLVAVFAALIAPYQPSQPFYSDALTGPSWKHLLGTDNIGRDVLSRVVYGAQITLEVVTLSIAGALVIGSIMGMVSGYFGGWVDDVMMRIVDAMMAFPMLILALAIIAVLGPDLINAIIAITIVNIPGFARLVRGQVLSIRQLDYVQAARCLGASDVRIMIKHIWPMVVGNVVVYSSLRASAAIITESALSFLGLGVQPPMPSWGSMLTTAMQYWDAWWLSVFPGLAIFVTVLALNFLGDGLRDALDVKIQD